MKPLIPRRDVLQPNLPDQATIKVIGLGGVGGIVARYLTLFLAALDCPLRLVFIDGDSFAPTNAGRMLFPRCGNKAAVVVEELLSHFTESSLAFIAIEEYVTTGNIQRLIQDRDLVILTVDNHATRKLVNDYCAGLSNLCLISGGNDGIERDAAGRQRRGTFGNVQIFVRQAGADVTPPLTHQHPEIQSPQDHHPASGSCTDLVASVPQILFTNLMVAACLLNTLWLYLCRVLHYQELAFDIADGLMRPVSSLKTPLIPGRDQAEGQNHGNHPPPPSDSQPTKTG